MFFIPCENIAKKTIKDIRILFNTEKKYPKFAEFRKRVLDVAVNELNDNITLTTKEREDDGKRIHTVYG